MDKPEGWTSHDVVARIRRLSGQRRVGHAGTLDPFATGVLLVCLGQATRVSEYLMESPKRYHAVIRFGAATDTYDVTGRVVEQTDELPPDLAAIEALLPRFTGRILQTPPPYSALKVGGQPAYRRARRGEAVRITPREVEVYELRVISWVPPDLELEVLCGRGTYIRSLAHDLGQAAGSAAHLRSLRRLAVGSFEVEQATPLAEIEAAFEADTWQELLFPIDEALLQYPALVVSREDVQRLLQGQPIQAAEARSGALHRVYGPEGEFVALVEGDQTAGLWRPHKVLLCR
ncbi:MAG: tRNA pseudouridine(55) synthase TruB [Anaerolineae bacterium]|nr:tRNA pseudouridine(55) synthase TruB [Anaerolineae bacterium]